jgi:phosphate-selective porin OprO/OprP
VFDGGLADPHDWTDRAVVTDIGWNWYPNKFVKFYFDWQHSMFGSPVLLNRATGERRTTNDLLWVRAQINF